MWERNSIEIFAYVHAFIKITCEFASHMPLAKYFTHSVIVITYDAVCVRVRVCACANFDCCWGPASYGLCRRHIINTMEHENLILTLCYSILFAKLHVFNIKKEQQQKIVPFFFFLSSINLINLHVIFNGMPRFALWLGMKNFNCLKIMKHN